MAFSRRDVLKWLAFTASSGPIGPALEGIAHALAARDEPSPVIWINGGGDHLNFLAQLGHELPDLLELAATRWDLVHYAPLENVAEETAEPLQAAPIVILEVIPPLGELEAEQASWPLKLLPQARTVILLGSDACYGGVRWGTEAVARLEGFCRAADTPVIKLPGVPVFPHHLIGTVAHLELIGFPRLDRYRRPTLYYGETICRRCERRGDLEAGEFARRFGEPGCLLKLGCKGPVTHNNCAVRKWSGGENWCVGAGGLCIGCAEPGYPNHGGLGLYGRLPDDRLGMRSPLLQHMEGIGWGILALAGLALGLKVLRGLIAPGGRFGLPGGTRGERGPS